MRILNYFWYKLEVAIIVKKFLSRHRVKMFISINVHCYQIKIVKADYGCVNSNITRVESLTLIQPGIQPQVKGDYPVIFE